MHARFYAPQLGGPGVATLPADESEHLVRVLRLGPGDVVAVFDGRGHEWLATVESAGRRAVTVRPTTAVTPAPEPSVHLTLAAAVTRGDRMDVAVRDAAMLGVSRVQPVIAARTEVQADAVRRGGRVERWQRIAVSSVKQCGRAVVPDVLAPLTLDEYLAREQAELRLILVEPRAADESRFAGISTPRSAALLIGPEGGWTPEEIDAARRAEFLPITLGQRTLRADATPLAAIAVLQYVWGDL